MRISIQPRLQAKIRHGNCKIGGVKLQGVEILKLLFLWLVNELTADQCIRVGPEKMAELHPGYPFRSGPPISRV